MDAIKKTLLDIVRKEGEKESFITHLMIYLLGTMMFSNTSCYVPNWIVDYIDDLSSLGRYAQAQAMDNWPMEDIPQTAAGVHARCSGKKINIGNLRGCIVVLNIWFYEVTKIRKKVCFGMIPQILCYMENSFRKQASLSPLLSSLDGKEIFSFLSQFSKYHLCSKCCGLVYLFYN